MSRAPAALRGDILFALALLVISVAYLAIAYHYKPALRAVPAAVASIMVALLAIDLLSRRESTLGRILRQRLNPASERPFYSAARQIEAILWVLGFAVLLVAIGVLYAVPIFVFAFMRFRGHRPIWASLLGGAAVTLFLWLLFAALLHLELYPGLLFGGA
jgi:Tripartite tricarboxylate transporter TctB family